MKARENKDRSNKSGEEEVQRRGKARNMENAIPRILIGGTGSGCGKTTVVCALLSALKKAGKSVVSFKCGPDYIDPMFHSEALNTKSRNLDIFLCGEETVKYLFASNAKGCDIALIEGAMGLYDGKGFRDDRCSANHVARLTETPTILVVDVRGKSLSLIAEIEGYSNFRENTISGVILNNCSAGMYPIYKEMLSNRGIKTFGYLPKVQEAAIASRHLGLVTASEISDIKKKLDLLGGAAEKSLDVCGLIQLASSASKLEYREKRVEKVTKGEPVKIGIARDKAFCFYYEDVIELLCRLGAEPVTFSPLEDTILPDGIKGLMIGGGYPELHLEKLCANRSMMKSIRSAVKAGMPTYAECGGFMYLGESIKTECGRYGVVGAIPGNSVITERLVRFGYKELTAKKDGVLCDAGDKIRCHEFHFSDTDVYGDGFSAENSLGRKWTTGMLTESMYAGYPHLHLWGNTDFAVRFVQACERFRSNVDVENDKMHEIHGDGTWK